MTKESNEQESQSLFINKPFAKVEIGSAIRLETDSGESVMDLVGIAKAILEDKIFIKFFDIQDTKIKQVNYLD